MTDRPEFDENLWIELEHCEGKHFLIGNPHTFKGRIGAYCPSKNTIFCISYSEINKMSVESDYWIKGYLSGNEPEPPAEYDGESATDYFQSKRYKEWEVDIQKFRKTGEIDDSY